MIYTAESVTAWHPDKICDQISDAIVDACLKEDSFARVAVEAIGGHNIIVLIGEVTTRCEVDFSSIAKKTYFDLTGKEIGVMCNIVKQSPEISQGVDKGGAGDQGIMIGYACNENEMFIPDELYYARKLLERFKTDGKSQVTIENGDIKKVVLSVQGKRKGVLHAHIRSQIGDVNAYCNNTGAFNIGGFDADSGCTGRKIVVDAYGPRVPVGGGAFSGKDATKVDRSGAYMARWIALQLLKKYGAKEVLVKLGYVIGGADPLMKEAYVDGRRVSFNYDCRPKAIIERFVLRTPFYLKTARYGHFGIKSYPWEQV